MTSLSSFTASHLGAARGLSQNEGWPHRPEDWRQMFELGDGLVAMDGDTLVGTIMWWTHPNHATLGMVIVEKDHRSEGLGGRLVSEALARIGNRTVALCATDMAHRGYARLGFKAVCAIHQLQADVPQVLPESDLPVRILDPSEIGEAAQLDQSATGLPREHFLREISSGQVILGAFEGEVLSAYALLRRAGRGHVIGPIVAPDLRSAKALVLCAIKQLKGGFVRVDTNPRLGLSAWLQELGLKRAGGGTAMVKGTLPLVSEQATAKLFGLASQAYG
ncbi:MAG: GNAT family N-acetyltransferase [Pseudomonadota bacterium]